MTAFDRVCKKCDFNIFWFPFFILLFFWGRQCRSKLHDESRLIQRSFDDIKGDDKKLKGQEHFMITKMMISRIKE